ncbi:hypothetical protein ACH4S8_27080 [Streptomyces sp. NPDC021080]|uniref:hypothetical protein n=1 Tax=Streptomyces sp. NPDC021080 TaxID=3365110 RepID=UPI0037AAB00E
MSDQRMVIPVGPDGAPTPDKVLVRMGVTGLVIAASGAVAGCFTGFRGTTDAGAIAWLTIFMGGLLTAHPAYVAMVRTLVPEQRRLHRRRAAVRRAVQAPLAAEELTRGALLAAVSSLGSEPVRPRPRPPVTDGRGRLVWWRDRDLRHAFGLTRFTAVTVVMTLVGLCGVLHVLGGIVLASIFLPAAALNVLIHASGIRLAHALAHLAGSERVHSMHYLLLREPYGGEAYLVLHPVEADPDAAGPMLLRLAKRKQARRLAPTGVAEVHGRLEPVTVVVPWIDGAPVWTRYVVNILDLTTGRDRARLTYLLGSGTDAP